MDNFQRNIPKTNLLDIVSIDKLLDIRDFLLATWDNDNDIERDKIKRIGELLDSQLLHLNQPRIFSKDMTDIIKEFINK